MTMEERLIGTISRGVRAPIIREGDDLAKIVVDSVIDAAAATALRFRIKILLPLRRPSLQEHRAITPASTTSQRM